VRDAFFASPQFPKLLNIEAVKDTIANGVTNGILGYVGKPGDEAKPVYCETDLHAYDIEISDDMYISTKEVAEEYKKIHVEKPKLTSLAISPSHTHLNPGASETFTARGLNQHNRDMPIGPVTWSATSGTIDANGVFIADQDEAELTITASVGGVGGSATVAVRSGVVRQKEKTKVARQTKLTWSGSVPPQKWTNFYMKVLTKFASTQEINMDLTVTFTIVATGDGQLSEQKIEETKIALRELGLDDDVVVG
jgi:hypothetical protein